MGSGVWRGLAREGVPRPGKPRQALESGSLTIGYVE